MQSLDNSLFNPIKNLSFDLLSQDSIKIKKAHAVLRKITSSTLIEIPLLPHNQFLNLLAYSFGFENWIRYRNYILSLKEQIEKNYKKYNEPLLDRLDIEDPLARLWYRHVVDENPNYSTPGLLFKDYLSVRENDFVRYHFSNIDVFGLNLGSSNFYNQRERLLGSLDWIYFLKCIFLYSRFYGICFRNSFFQEVTFNYSTFVSDDKYYGSDFMGSTFSFCSLEEADLSKSYFRGTTFYNSNLKKAKFKSCNMQGAIFKSCDLKFAKFKNIHLGSMIFRDCDLENANFSDSSFSYLSFERCNLKNIKGIDPDKFIRKRV